MFAVDTVLYVFSPQFLDTPDYVILYRLLLLVLIAEEISF